jgi:aspartate 1-decarboxylase
MRSFVAGTIYGVIATGKRTTEQCSVTIARELLAEADIEPFEVVDVVSASIGERFTSYVLPGEPGEFTLNGPVSRMGEVGDRFVIVSYREEEIFSGARFVEIAGDNHTWAVGWYEHHPRADKAEVAYRKRRGSVAL